MLFNTTGISQPSSSYSGAPHPYTHPGLAHRSVGNLGYGLGRLARLACEALLQSSQKFIQGSPKKELTPKQKIEIHQHCLQTNLKQLSDTLERLRKNPRDSGVIKKVQTVMNQYLKVALQPPLAQINSAKRSLEQTGWPALYNLAGLNGANGVTIPGLAPNNLLGFSVSTAGDLNGDGLSDFVIGATGVSSNAGAVYVIFGQRTGWPAIYNLTTLNGTNGFVIPGFAANYFGIFPSAAGDFNADGISDIAIGDYLYSGGAGATFVLFGKTTGWSPSFNLTSLNGANGCIIRGLAYVSGLLSSGDINGDGLTDLVIPGSAPSGSGSNVSAAYVLFGKASGWSASVNLSALSGTEGFVIQASSPNDRFGSSIAVGDVNGDGKGDLILGASSYSAYAGGVYVVFGQSTGWPVPFDLATLNGANGFFAAGVAAGDELGSSVAAVDINRDGYADVVIGAPKALRTGIGLGLAYVLFGRAIGWSANVDLATLNGITGFSCFALRSPGVSANQLGQSVNSAGDVNNDGIKDVVFAAPGSSSAAGAAYLVFGQQTGWPASLNLTALDGRNGCVIPGLAFGYLGTSVGTAGDVNGDGRADLLLGAPGVTSGTGNAYLIFGQGGSSVPPSASLPSGGGPLATPPIPSSSSPTTTGSVAIPLILGWSMTGGT